MPEYHYQCVNCKHIFLVIHNIHIKYRNMVCPHCEGWVQVKRLIGKTNFTVHGYSAKNGYSKRRIWMHRVVDERNAFQLNEYQGTYELVAGNVRDDKFSMNWSIASRYDDEIGGGAPVMRDDEKYMNIPVKVILGDREHAIENLEWLLGKLEGHVAEVPLSAEKSEENVPF